MQEDTAVKQSTQIFVCETSGVNLADQFSGGSPRKTQMTRKENGHGGTWRV
ncbi:hypothetical protein TBK1r_08100 [Stieleria magnilauensis]|uniref:Uncharacterized protein n=1 Tax=Stieleria magnilauensis TaxID=2527963 RepID=A0ABX5XJJ6_9BACT|nr:hypothetical protein TBK1r_08100 [Planctomycetes bacterium TBK1r]